MCIDFLVFEHPYFNTMVYMCKSVCNYSNYIRSTINVEDQVKKLDLGFDLTKFDLDLD